MFKRVVSIVLLGLILVRAAPAWSIASPLGAATGPVYMSGVDAAIHIDSAFSGFVESGSTYACNTNYGLLDPANPDTNLTTGPGSLWREPSTEVMNWCSNTNTLRSIPWGNSTGQATGLNTGAGTNGSRGIFFTQNVGAHGVNPASGESLLYLWGSVPFLFDSGQTSGFPANGNFLPRMTWVRQSSNLSLGAAAQGIAAGLNVNLEPSTNYLVFGTGAASTTAAATSDQFIGPVSAGVDTYQMTIMCGAEGANTSNAALLTAPSGADSCTFSSGTVLHRFFYMGYLHTTSATSAQEDSIKFGASGGSGTVTFSNHLFVYVAVP